MGYAKVAGMDVDLGLGIGARYSICLLVFFPAYLIIEIPSNYVLVRFGVWKTLTFLIFAWGLMVLLMGFVSNWVAPAFPRDADFKQGLAALRFWLGIFEGGVSPAVIYLISSWYRRYETHSRIAWMYSVGLIASAFAGSTSLLTLNV